MSVIIRPGRLEIRWQGLACGNPDLASEYHDGRRREDGRRLRDRQRKGALARRMAGVPSGGEDAGGGE